MKIFDYKDLGEKKSWNYSMENKSPEDEGIKPILETDKEIEMGSVLIINGIAYTVCCLSGKNNKYHTAYVERIPNQSVFTSDEEPEEQDYTDEIVCPYCGSEIESFEMDDENDDYECDFCGSHFSYQRNVSVSYCSQPVSKAEINYLN